MTGTKNVNWIAWDSCVFLAWFKAEQDKPLDIIEMLLKQIEEGKLRLLVSAICGAEVLDKAGQSDAGTKFIGFLKRENVEAANVDMRIAQRAARLRERLVAAVEAKSIAHGLRAPDAIVVATALIYRVSVLHTFDPHILALSETVYVDGLKIAIPSDPAGPLPLFDQ